MLMRKACRSERSIWAAEAAAGSDTACTVDIADIADIADTAVGAACKNMGRKD